jgi:hypothetical protein
MNKEANEWGIPIVKRAVIEESITSTITSMNLTLVTENIVIKDMYALNNNRIINIVSRLRPPKTDNRSNSFGTIKQAPKNSNKVIV